MPQSDERVNTFIEALEDAGFEPESYSGRGMFGKECVSIREESEWNVARSLPEDMDVPPPHRDQLGLGIVLYWPSYEWPEGRE